MADLRSIEREELPDLGFVRAPAVFADLEGLGEADLPRPLLPVPLLEALPAVGRDLDLPVRETLPEAGPTGLLAFGILRKQLGDPLTPPS